MTDKPYCDECELPEEICACEDAREYDAMTDKPQAEALKAIDPNSDESALVRVQMTVIAGPFSASFEKDVLRICEIASRATPEPSEDMVERIAKIIEDEHCDHWTTANHTARAIIKELETSRGE